MAHRFSKWRTEICAMRRNGAHSFATAHHQNVGAPKNLLKIAETAIAKDDLVTIFLGLRRETDF